MLEYIGDGSGFFNIPARNLKEEEIEKLQAMFGWKDLRGFLLNSDLYRELGEETPPPIPVEPEEEE